MKTIFFWVGMMLGIFTATYAQNARLHTLGITYGYQHYSRQDQLFSPLIYKGTAPLNLELNYRISGHIAHQRVHLSFGMYNMSAHDAYDFIEDFDELEERTLHPSTFQMIRVGYSYERKFGGNNDLQWRAGLGINGQIEAMFYEMGFASIFGYTTSFALAPSVGLDYYLGDKTTLSSAFSVPVAGLVARSPYALNDDDYIERQSSHNNLTTIVKLIGDSELRSLNTYRQVDMSVQMQHQLARNTSFSIGWQGQWYEITEPRRVVALQNGFNAGMHFKF